MKAWLCGPASAGYKDAEEALKSAGIAPVYGPHDLTLPATANPDDIMRARIKLMMDCDTVVLLDGWSSDPASDLEHHIAKRVGMRCSAKAILLSAGV